MDRPIHTRRTFLYSVSGGILLLSQRGFAVSDTQRAVSIAIVSDTHLGRSDGTTAREHWWLVADELRQSDVAFVLHLGDIVDNGTESEYPTYLETRNSVGKPVYEIPGNHDPEHLFEKYISETSDRCVDHESLRFILLNNARFGEHDGFLTDSQLDWLEIQCRDGADNKLALFICMHIPAHYNIHPDRGWYIKPDKGQTRFYNIVDRYRDSLRGIFHGHFHNGIRGWSDRVPEIACPSLLYNQDRDLEAQGAPGFNLKEFRPGYTLLDIHPDTIELRYKPIGASLSVEKQL